MIKPPVFYSLVLNEIVTRFLSFFKNIGSFAAFAPFFLIRQIPKIPSFYCLKESFRLKLIN